MQNFSHRLLRAEEEVSLGLRIQAGNQAMLTLNDTDLDAAERRQYERLVAEGKDAQDTLITHSIRLVRWCAQGFVGAGRDLDDMVSDGLEALVIVTPRFDPAAGNKFSTFATPHVNGAIQFGLDWGHVVREPRDRAQKRRRLSRAEARLMASTGSQPTTEDLAKATNLPVTYIEDLEHTVDPRIATLDGVPELACPNSSTAETVEVRSEAERCLGLMTTREAQVVRMFWGLDGLGTKKNQKEVAELLRVNQSTVSRLYNRGIRRARESHELVAA